MVALRFNRSVVAVIASFAAVSAVHSADLTVPPLAPVQDFSGWYLRGDTGLANGSMVAESRLESATNNKFDAVPFFGVGEVGGAFMPDRYTGSKYEWTFLFNGYPGLGAWWNLTPFLGAGAGSSRSDIAGHQAWPAAQLRWLRFNPTGAAQG
ncbi:MAG TPA: hypothetical protein VEC94_10450 [Pseudolabrys sp.]|nr:hypothetical protein [Pseudolabrys sp.]